MQRQLGFAAARVTLAGTAPLQLAINPVFLVAFGGDYMQAPQFSYALSQGDICSPAGHIGGYGDLPGLARQGDNLCLFLILAGIKHLVGKPPPGQERCQ